MSMRLYPNQKVIKIQKEKSNKENIYSIMNIQALQVAVNQLSHNGLMLWIYLNKNQDKYTLGLSKADILNKWGIGSKSSYDRAVAELIDKQFLIQIDNKDDYIFYELPQKYKNNIQP